ncbi:MAG TPA: tungstate ABC transporter substrate-binding protein WtpA [Anaerolineaceae bacterium]|nr:tungstate ABC transporter substrate-binding protein WtpA [Anaerolineaceae bacterium]
MKRFTQALTGFLCAGLLLSGCGPKPKTPLVLFAADSLIQPFGDLTAAFEAEHPDIDVQAEYHGSIQVMRHVTELHVKIDVVATADQALIPLLMYQQKDPETGKPYAAWYLRFATNRLALAYTPKSQYAAEINGKNWAEVITRPGVRLGLSDPRFDASGYRTLMVLKLAEQTQGPVDLFSRVFAGQFTYPIKVTDEAGLTRIRVPEILETRKDTHLVVRGAAMELLALLESGDIDYFFEYESVIQQHGLKMVSLPASLDLGEAAENPNYGKVAVLLDFQRFASVKPEFRGEQIGYGITIPSNAPHSKQAEEFVAFLLSRAGRQIMERDHHPLFDPVPADGYEALPPGLKALAAASR